MQYEIGDRVKFQNKRRPNAPKEIGIISGIDRGDHRRGDRPHGTVYYIRPERNDLWEERYEEELEFLL